MQGYDANQVIYIHLCLYVRYFLKIICLNLPGKPASIEYPEVVLAPGQTSGETIIKNAVKICSISVRSDGDGNPCKDEANYGIDYKDPRKIWTKNGCQGRSLQVSDFFFQNNFFDSFQVQILYY